MSFSLNEFNKYKNSACEIFKIRMQLKAEINDLRKTYQAIVLEKPVSNRKHFAQKLHSKTNLLPQQENSYRKKSQRKHLSPNFVGLTIQRSSYSGKKQYENKKKASQMSLILKSKDSKRKKQLSPVFNQRMNRSMMQFRDDLDGLKIGLHDKSVQKMKKSSKRIISKYHQYNCDLLTG